MRALVDPGEATQMITVESLSKRYQSTAVVCDVSLSCAPGTITGLLGPNGAGKSTILRMITGLTRPDSGTALVNGRPYVSLPNPAREVGTLLGASAMHVGRSGRATLRIAARTCGVPQSRVEEVLQKVGLAGGAAGQLVGTYSLEMRQRLGLAQAMVGDPRILILDEPADGLGPGGMAWMRTLLRDFADRGGTVLLSSHLPVEVQATVDHLVIISGGVVAASPSLRAPLTTGLLVRSAEPDMLTRVLDAAGISYAPSQDGAVVVDTSTGITADTISHLARDHRVQITHLQAAGTSGLEALFRSLTAPTPSEKDAV